MGGVLRGGSAAGVSDRALADGPRLLGRLGRHLYTPNILMRSTLALPSEGDLASLPYFAILALGAACAKRVAPVFETWEGATREQARALTRAVKAVEDLAESPTAVSRMPHWVSARQSTRLAAEAASEADMGEAPEAVLCAADAAAELAGALDQDVESGPAARAVRRVLEASVGALEDGDGSRGDELVRWVTGMVERLRERAIEERWTNQSPVTLRER